MKISCPVLKERIKKELCIGIQQAADGEGEIEGLEMTPRQIKKCRRCGRRPENQLSIDDMVLIDIIDGEF